MFWKYWNMYTGSNRLVESCAWAYLPGEKQVYYLKQTGLFSSVSCLFVAIYFIIQTHPELRNTKFGVYQLILVYLRLLLFTI